MWKKGISAVNVFCHIIFISLCSYFLGDALFLGLRGGFVAIPYTPLVAAFAWPYFFVNLIYLATMWVIYPINRSQRQKLVYIIIGSMIGASVLAFFGIKGAGDDFNLSAAYFISGGIASALGLYLIDRKKIADSKILKAKSISSVKVLIKSLVLVFFIPALIFIYYFIWGNFITDEFFREGQYEAGMEKVIIYEMRDYFHDRKSYSKMSFEELHKKGILSDDSYAYIKSYWFTYYPFSPETSDRAVVLRLGLPFIGEVFHKGDFTAGRGDPDIIIEN